MSCHGDLESPSIPISPYFALSIPLGVPGHGGMGGGLTEKRAEGRDRHVRILDDGSGGEHEVPGGLTGEKASGISGRESATPAAGQTETEAQTAPRPGSLPESPTANP